MLDSFQTSKVLFVDFEGSLHTGIRQAGFVLAVDGRITQAHEIVNKFSEDEMQSKLVSFFSEKIVEMPERFCSHNCSTDKNLLSAIMPYFRPMNTDNKLNWGPWIDTLDIYRQLYPGLQSYDLKTLVETFIRPEALKKTASEHCKGTKRTFHNALYDAICCFHLWLRLHRKLKANVIK